MAHTRIGFKWVKCPDCQLDIIALAWGTKCGNCRYQKPKKPSKPRVYKPKAFTFFDVASKHGWQCSVCGQPIDDETPRHQPGGAKVVHGNPDELSNARLAHQVCAKRFAEGA